MPDKDSRIKDHDAFYRRGLVLGLTMAEIMVLVLFTLLLAIAATLSVKDTHIKDQSAQLSKLEGVKAELAEILRGKPPGVTVEDIVQRIDRQRNEITALKGEVARLQPLETKGQVVDDILRELHQTGIDKLSPHSVVEKVRLASALQRENQTLRGQNVQLSSQIKRSGRGNEFPSCWVTPTGQIESVFIVTFKKEGIVVTDRQLPHRSKERAELPLTGVQFEEALGVEQFRRFLAPLYQWSKEHNCRFYVIRFSTSNEAHVAFVNAVNAFFYPDSSIKIRSGF
jgi:hypothetical protein